MWWTVTAWQADLALWRLMGHTRTVAEPLEQSPGQFIHPAWLHSMRPLFRGEPFDPRDHSLKPLTSTAIRSGLPVEAVTRLNRLFALVVDQVVKPWERHGVEVPALSWWAVARHYGMPSTLLDLTADPSVATHFADGSSRREAAVYCIPAAWCIERGLKPLLPPPACDRLYLQRGVLLDTTDLKEGELLDNSSQIVFPTSGHHEVIRPVPLEEDGSPDIYWGVHSCKVVNIDPDASPRAILWWRLRDNWFRRVVRWVRDHVEQVGEIADADAPRIAKGMVMRVGEPRFLDASFSRYSRAVTKLLVWVAGLEVEPGRFALDPQVRAQLLRDNPFLAGAEARLPWLSFERDPGPPSASIP